MKALQCLAVAGLCCVALGCATRFSPGKVRNEIVRQRGVDPQRSFEFNLGRFTTFMLKSALTTEGGDVPFAGLREIQLSVYETPEHDGPAIDVTLFAVRGWEPVIRARDERRSIMILVRSPGRLPWSDSDGTIGDLVVVGAGPRKVVYGRLQGTLSRELPSQLGDLFREGGPEEVMDLLSSVHGSTSN